MKKTYTEKTPETWITDEDKSMAPTTDTHTQVE